MTGSKKMSPDNVIRRIFCYQCYNKSCQITDLFIEEQQSESDGQFHSTLCSKIIDDEQGKKNIIQIHQHLSTEQFKNSTIDTNTITA